MSRLAADGLFDGEMRQYRPDIIRIGRSERMRSGVKENISLDSIVQRYLQCPPGLPCLLPIF